MMRTIYILFLLLSGNLLTAQQPGIDDSIMSIKRKWTKGANVVVAADPALKSTHYSFIYKKLDSIATLFKQAYPTPTGTEAQWYSSVRGGPYFSGGPSPYSFNALFKFFYYNKSYKKLMATDETGTWAYVFVNDLNWLVDDTKLEIKVNGLRKKVWQLSPEKGEWKGNVVYEPYLFSPTSKVIVITKNGQMPWQWVTQQQYLDALKAKTEAEKQSGIADYDKGIAEARKMIENIRNSQSYSAELKEKMISAAEKELGKQIQQKEENQKKAAKHFDERIKIIDDYMATHPADLQKPAIINAFHDFFFQKSFTDPNDKAARKLIYIDQSYFDKKLPSYMPQFFTLMWRWNENAPGLFFKKQLEENFPIEKLRAMLPGANKAGKVFLNNILPNQQTAWVKEN